MQIYGSSFGLPDRLPSHAGGSTYEASNNVQPGEARRAEAEVAAARATALSALRNERFGSMLATLSEPAASGTLMTMTREADSAGADYNSVVSSYAENSGE